MSDLFAYNPPPWSAARCGDNWDIVLPSEPEATGVGVVATCFAGEHIASLIAAAPELYAALERLLACSPPSRATHHAEEILAKARGEEVGNG